MQNEKHSEEELKQQAPTLFSIPKADPFVRDEAFFEKFPHQVQALVVARESGGWTSWWQPALVGAIPAALLITAIAIFLSAPEPTAPIQGVENTVAEVTMDDLEAVDPEFEMIAFTEDQEFTFDEVNVDLTEDELHAYLEDYDLDLEQLMNEL